MSDELATSQTLSDAPFGRARENDKTDQQEIVRRMFDDRFSLRGKKTKDANT